MTRISTPDWVKDAIFYQIFPDRFASSRRVKKPANLQPWGSEPTTHGFQGGDLAGVIEKIDYLADLGINAIYFNPIFASASNHRYHTFDYYRIDPLLGDDAIFDELVTTAHAHGIRIILDGVFNHASRGFFQFNHLMECGTDSPYVDWFEVYNWPVNAFAPEPPNYAAWWGIPALPKFNVETPAVREFLWDVAVYWLKRGIDGWRLDVPNEIDDDAFWQEFRRRCRAVNPEAYIVGELWDEADRWLQGDQFDAQMNYLFTRAVVGFFLGDKADQRDTVKTGLKAMPSLTGSQFAAEFDRIFNHLYHPEITLAQMNMLGSHDTPRIMTVAQHDVRIMKLIFLCLMTAPGAPNIYYGDEIGLPGRGDPDCRRAFPWDDEESWQQGLQADVRRFIVLRRETPALRRGRLDILAADGNVVVYQRVTAAQRAIIAFNAGEESEKVQVSWTNEAGTKTAALPEALTTRVGSLNNGQIIELEAYSARVWVGSA